MELLEEDTARRIEEAVRRNVEERLKSEEVKLEIERRIAEGLKKKFDDVEIQLQKEKQEMLAEARRKDVSIRCPLFCEKDNRGKFLIILKLYLEWVSNIETY